jgi:signal transduction histidine kinase
MENLEILKDNEMLNSYGLSTKEKQCLFQTTEKQFLYDYLNKLVYNVDNIMSISPSLDWREILVTCAERIVKSMGADAGSIRLHDQETGKMVSFGSYHYPERKHKRSLSIVDSISGMVALSGQTRLVPNIQKEPHYQNKDVVREIGLNSLIAVPIHIPTFLEGEKEIRASLQIYYQEIDRSFNPLEVLHAEVLAKRLSYVVARKRIIDLSRLNQQKEKLVEAIFTKLSNREGIRMKDMFRLMVPELANIIRIQHCALFSVSLDRYVACLEVSYPVQSPLERTGSLFTIEDYPYIHELLREKSQKKDTITERIDPSYILIKDPINSPLSNQETVNFTRHNKIHSILLVPLRTTEIIRYFMVFYVTDQRQSFTDEEIEILAFFSKEVMKALRMARLDDILHDFKSPAIAIGGFARRARRLIENKDLNSVRDQLREALDIVAKETERMEKLITSSKIEGRERPIDAGDILKRRFQINTETIKRQGRRRISQDVSDVEIGLLIYCNPIEYERTLDNLLTNATKAVPFEGGIIKACCFRHRDMVQIEIKNTGRIADEKIVQIQKGNDSGRGLSIIHRFIQDTGGNIEIITERDETIFMLTLPLYKL